MIRAVAFFGAFNPPTRAHLELADYARRATGREAALFVPSRAAYIRDCQGKDRAFSDAERLRMLNALAAHRPWMRVCDWELHQEAQPRTYTTLCHLREEGYAPTLLMGSDKLAELATGWKYVPEIAREFGIVVLGRNTDDAPRMIREDPFLRSLGDAITVLETPNDTREVSSTAVRQTLRQIEEKQQELRRMVPEELLEMLLTVPRP